MDLKNKNVLIAGVGLSGIGAANLLHKVGANITLYDGNAALLKDDILVKLPKDCKAKVILGELIDEEIEKTDVFVISPGIPTDLEFVKRIKAKNIPVWGEIELANQYAKGKIIAITGTNGKTTTTVLTGEIMKKHFESTFVVGNIGMPFTDVVFETKNESLIVAELSSFQLETIVDFKPSVSAVLNISPDHLNRHKTMESYIEAKLMITYNQDENDVCVLNYDDEETRKLSDKINTKKLWFSRCKELDDGVFVSDNSIVCKINGDTKHVCKIEELKLLGNHNIENVLAAVGMSVSVGVSIETIKEAITSFMGVEHRIEYVCTKNDVIYYNDSKGTNPNASIKAVEAMVRPTILIGGGYNKDSEYDEWINSFDNKVKKLILIGETKDKIEESANRNGFFDIIKTDTLEEAVKKAFEISVGGDAVLLSPACASWDMFKNYEERGNKFKEYVYNLGE